MPSTVLRSPKLAALIAVLILAAGCSSQPTSSPEASAGPTARPTASPSPSPSPKPTASPSPSPSPTPLADHCPGKTAGKHVGSAASEHSENWAGYIAYIKKTQFTCVEGSWTQPSLTCPASGSADVAIWIGIDGVTSSNLGVDAGATLVQIGTEAGCDGGTKRAFAWYQVIPQDELSQTIDSLGILPGDVVHALVSYADGTYTLQLVDETSGDSFVTTRDLKDGVRQTAEWIVEAPMVDCPSNCTIAVLPDFTKIFFTSAYATVGSTWGPIDLDAWRHGITTMTRGGTTRATVSVLSSGGTAFYVIWKHQ